MSLQARSYMYYFVVDRYNLYKFLDGKRLMLQLYDSEKYMF